ncbi:hypothetical protein MUN46_004145 [Mesosutterella sp. AGMB02718]|uniref:Glycosyltransferase RgtA/B/C/D-like domain-containing protein n=1 Tax=Mesosutterella faecium TaxID=2925194 RepID=A0ABT7IL85_9BURK|nr:hypothetical protein [Mesosutterella sp. AGMB02718]MDL2059134.1 hypothetical protein [Mesosutterella sp. AGMB02718]
MLSSHQSPLIISASAAARLPRWALLVLLATLALAGFSGHFFWIARDEQVFGLMWTMARGTWADWVLPNIAGQEYSATGPGIAWLGAALIRLSLSVLPPFPMAKISGLLWFALAASSVWYGTWHLARREEAQPISMLFGEEASPRDYSRTVADSATLLFVASFGLLSRIHEIGLPIVVLGCWSMGTAGVIWSLAHKKAGAVAAGAAAGLMTLCGNIAWGGCLLAAELAVIFFVRSFRGGRLSRAGIACGSMAAVVLIWPLSAHFAGVPFDAWAGAWSAVQSSAFAWITPNHATWLLRNFIWYLCPMWPFAVYALYAWHRVIGCTQIMLPLISAGAAFVAPLFAAGIPELSLLAMAPSVAILAAFGLAALKRRSYENLLDWFSATIFSLGAVGLWCYYIAWRTGFPPKMANSVERLAPGVVPWVEGSLLFATAAVTVLWFAIVAKRLRRRPKALWRGPWLAALGITLFWVEATALFSPVLDAYRSYTPVAREISGKLRLFGYSSADCVFSDAIPSNLRGLLYYSGVHFGTGEKACRFTLSKIKKRDAIPSDAIGIPTFYPRSEEAYLIRPGASKPLQQSNAQHVKGN